MQVRQGPNIHLLPYPLVRGLAAELGSGLISVAVAGHVGVHLVMVDLDGHRMRRLLRPWPGWWGGHELRSATWAERTRREAWSA